MDAFRFHQLEGHLPSNTALLFCAIAWVVLWVLVQAVVLPWRRLAFYRKQGLRGPPYIPLLGNLLELQKLQTVAQKPIPIDEGLTESTFPHLLRWVKKYAPGQRRLLFQTLTTTKIVLWDASLVKEFLAKHDSYVMDYQIRKLVEKWMGEGLLLERGELWARQRKHLNPGFRLQFLKGFLHHMKEAGSELLHDWLHQVHLGGGRSAEISIDSGIQKATRDIIARAVFGAEAGGSLPVDAGDRVFEALEQLINMGVERKFTLRFLLGRRGLGSLLPETETEKKITRLDSFVNSMLKEIVEARAKAVQSAYATKGSVGRDSNENVGGHDLLSLMVDAMLRGSETMTLAQVLHECRTIFVGGQSTTARFVTWTLLLLAHHPEWQEKVREEITQVTAGTGVLEPQSIDKLRIMGMILNEALRLYSPASVLGRVAVVRHKLGDLDILPGTEVQFSISMLHTCEEYWPDALSFKPERFAGGIAAATVNKADAFLPFSGGPRICIGQNFALMSAKTLLASLLHRLRFRVSPKYQHLVGSNYFNGQRSVLLVVEDLGRA